MEINRTIIVALVIFLMGTLLLAWGLYWRGEALEARASAQRCSDGVAEMKRLGDSAKKASARALTEARKLNAPLAAEVARLETMIKNRPPNANCDEAWRQIETDATGSPR